MMTDIIIIGGGLSGLTAAYLLKKQGLNVLVLEAANQLGGRIKTTITETGAALEMGATWVFNDYYLKTLLRELGIGIYEQFNQGYGLYETSLNSELKRFPANEMTGGQSYHKIAGGSYQIIAVLTKKIGKENIYTNAIVEKIEDNKTFLRVKTSDESIYEAKNIIITIPPRLLEASITFLPKLSQTASQIRRNTHTWMGDSVKFSIEYKTPFWRNNNLAGLAVSNFGLVREVQDHVNALKTAYGLVGFLDLTEEQINWPMEKRKEYVIKDLIRIFGKDAKDAINYEDYIWNLNPFIALNQNSNQDLYPHQNNGKEGLIVPQMTNKLFFAGAETSSYAPGRMEGAIESAIRASNHIDSVLKSK
jgi:monoamine oxidase